MSYPTHKSPLQFRLPECIFQFGTSDRRLATPTIHQIEFPSTPEAEDAVQKITGGCLCGAVRYTANGPSLRMHLCHCRDCKRFTGTAFGAGIVFPATSVVVDGELRSFDVMGGSGHLVHRKFCSRCGSGVLVTADVKTDIVVVQAGSLDDPSLFIPTTEFFTDAALVWVHTPGGFPKGQQT